MLEFDETWIFEAPADDELHHGVIPGQAINSFVQLIRIIAREPNRGTIWEHFKEGFCRALGQYYGRSSSADYAEIDCQSQMRRAGANAPVFINAFYESWTELESSNAIPAMKVVARINAVLKEHSIGYRVEPPKLVVLGDVQVLAEINVPDSTAETAQVQIRQSLQLAARHMAEGNARAAVLESLWLLDSALTLYSGLELSTGRVNGDYFSPIVADLRRLLPGTSFAAALKWMDGVYGYLSSPGGGQIRHGMNLLRADLTLTETEARLYCGLIRAFVEFLLAEHARIAGTAAS